MDNRYMKGQVSVELLIVVGLALVIILPTLVGIYLKVSEHNERLAVAQVDIAASRLAHVADTVYYGGEGSAMVTEIIIPNCAAVATGGGASSCISAGFGTTSREIVFTLETSSGTNEVVKLTKGTIDTAGSNISALASPGTYHVEVENTATGIKINLIG
jgi:hypothetical protein